MADNIRHGVTLYANRNEDVSIQRDGEELARLQFHGLTETRRGVRARVVVKAPPGIVARLVDRAVEGEEP